MAVFSVLNGTGIDSNNDATGDTSRNIIGGEQPDAIINVYSDHALTAADFVF